MKRFDMLRKITEMYKIKFQRIEFVGKRCIWTNIGEQRGLKKLADVTRAEMRRFEWFVCVSNRGKIRWVSWLTSYKISCHKPSIRIYIYGQPFNSVRNKNWSSRLGNKNLPYDFEKKSIGWETTKKEFQ